MYNLKAMGDISMKKGFLYTIIGAVSWGFSGSMGQHLFETYHVNAPWLVSVRMIFAGIILCIVSMMTMPHATRNLLKRIWLLRSSLP